MEKVNRILVAAARSTLRQDGGDLSDSGKIVTDESVHLHFAGRPLKPHATHCWEGRA